MPEPQSELTTNDILSVKEQGNAHFKAQEWDEALVCYTKALKLECSSADKVALLKNRAAVHLKHKNYEGAEKDASAVLEMAPTDTKALFRRSQAREGLQRYGEAFQDAKTALHYEPKDKAISEALQKLSSLVQQQQKEAESTSSRVSSMFKLAFDESESEKKRNQAMNNLLVLARSRAGADLIWSLGAGPKLFAMSSQASTSSTVTPNSRSYPTYDNDGDEDVTLPPENLNLAAQRVLDELAKDSERASNLLNSLGNRACIRLLDKNDQKVSDAASVFVQRLFDSLAGFARTDDKRTCDPELVEKNKVELTGIIFELKSMLTDPKVCAIGRESAIDLLLKNLMAMDGGLPRGWSWRFVEDDGLERLLRVACNIPELSYLPVTSETREHVAICLTRLYDDMLSDQRRTNYQNECEKMSKELIAKGARESRVQICALCTTLLQGPFDVGFSIISSQGVLDIMLEMAGTEDVLLQGVAAEAIVHTASKRERCSAIISQGIPVLKKLYESADPHIKARALVGLCKCASSSGSDATSKLKPMAEGSSLMLAKTCRKFLLDSKQDIDLRRWAAEGLAYLTLDADVKEYLVQDALVIRALVDLAKDAGTIALFGVASIFVNLTNSYEVQKADPEMVKLAQFAKHHVPEEHPKDAQEYVEKRIDLLVKEGAVSACVVLTKTDSDNCKELLCRALRAFATNREHRGTIVQEGGAKALVKLAVEGSPQGRIVAAHALAKIGVSMDPQIAFPGQRIHETVRPLLSLLHVECTGLENYEALLTLTNISSVSETVRKRIVKEKAVPKIEEYWYMQDHEELRAAAAECYLNLLHCQEGFDTVAKVENDRLKLWLLYCSEEEERLARASSAGIALLTKDPVVCKRIPKEVQSWLEVFEELAGQEDAVVQERGMLAIVNMIKSDFDIAAQMMQSKIFEVLLCVSKLPEDVKRKKSQELAKEALKEAEKLDLIKPTDREFFERQQAANANAQTQKFREIASVPEDKEES